MERSAATAEEAVRPMAREAFAELVEPHLDGLYGYCMRLSDQPADAQDLLQESLARAVRSADGLRDPDRVRPWLFTIATNAWRDHHRSRGRQVDTVSLDASDPDDEFSLFATLAVEDPFPYSDELHLDFLRLFGDEEFQAVFGSISEVHRLPLILTTIHGFSCKEAAAILDVPLGTLLSRLHRGRKQLEQGLWDYAVRNALVKVSDDED
ncbi:MAG TPA: sigma-70 family RNA polymerase sigma factor [Candidatus Limnocylindrales bacterium]|jgi:RNA polymerase sigma-70 factor, ECF subfamily|nr:sigma-70 family RNA polymerase sigma factor [Candidatus Limnocylindrales bacterium]